MMNAARVVVGLACLLIAIRLFTSMPVATTTQPIIEQAAEQPITGQTVAQAAGRKCLPVASGQVNANYYDTSSGYWAGQFGGMHLGTDYGAPQGEPVYAPFDFDVQMVGFYGDPGRYGYYIQGWTADGQYLIYLGHLQNVNVANGEHVAACTQIAEIGPLIHTHVKMAPLGAPIPCEGSGTCIDFEQYYKEH